MEGPLLVAGVQPEPALNPAVSASLRPLSRSWTPPIAVAPLKLRPYCAIQICLLLLLLLADLQRKCGIHGLNRCTSTKCEQPLTLLLLCRIHKFIDVSKPNETFIAGAYTHLVYRSSRPRGTTALYATSCEGSWAVLPVEKSAEFCWQVMATSNWHGDRCLQPRRFTRLYSGHVSTFFNFF